MAVFVTRSSCAEWCRQALGLRVTSTDHADVQRYRPVQLIYNAEKATAHVWPLLIGQTGTGILNNLHDVELVEYNSCSN